MLRRIWKFVAVRENRDALAWVLGGCAVLVSGGWTAFTYFQSVDKPKLETKDSSTKLSLERCILLHTQDNAEAFVRHVKSVLSSGDFRFGWSGGIANNNKASEVTDYPIVNVKQEDDTLVIDYKYSDGVMRLKPVQQDYSYFKSDGKLQGEWIQTNGTGCIEFLYSIDNDKLWGYWDTGPGSERGLAYIRRSK
jgi:hypothetical protein